MNMVKYSQNT